MSIATVGLTDQNPNPKSRIPIPNSEPSNSEVSNVDPLPLIPYTYFLMSNPEPLIRNPTSSFNPPTPTCSLPPVSAY